MRAYQDALIGFSRLAGETMPLERLLQNATAQVSRVTHIRHVKVLRYRPDVGDLLVEAGVGWKDGVVGSASLALDYRSPGGRSIQTSAPIAIEDLPNDQDYRYSDLLRDHGVVSVLNVPIAINGETWGVLEVDATERTVFDDIDSGALTIFANLLGVGIGRLRSQNSMVEATAEISRRERAKEILLRELQHRVKNNFQVIISFLTLQARAASAETRDRLHRAIDRVFAVSLAHDQLTLTGESGGVDFADYLRALCANIDPARTEVAIEVSAASFVVPLDRVVPAGLIVNELVTNSIKYAFGENGGRIRVVFDVNPDIGEAMVMVEDDGRGLPTERPSRGLGLSLVAALATQLSGRVEYGSPTRGARTVLRFPVSL
jgi:two-component sensor histidine kinase